MKFPPRATLDNSKELPLGLRTAYVSQWNFSLQHSLNGSDSMELEYLGASGHKLVNVYDLDQCRPSANLFCDPATKPWPRYSALLYVDSSSNSSYEALLAKYEHCVASGLSLRFEHSLAKALTDTFQTGQALYNQISDCRRCSKGPATFDVSVRLVRDRAHFGSTYPRPSSDWNFADEQFQE